VNKLINSFSPYKTIHTISKGIYLHIPVLLSSVFNITPGDVPFGPKLEAYFSQFYVHVTVHRNKFPYNKTKKMH